jgi:inosine/xanthosine triphosphatase
MKVAVGSENPVKIEATKLAFQAIWPEISWEVVGVNVSSGVADQPMSDEESIKGATNRSKAAIEAVGADYGVGPEGGIQKIGKYYFDCGWIVVINKSGEKGIGSTVKIIVPSKIMKLIYKGMELGLACDKVFKDKNTKQNQGYFGLMTKDVTTRTSGYKDGVVMALVRFVHPQLFK